MEFLYFAAGAVTMFVGCMLGWTLSSKTSKDE